MTEETIWYLAGTIFCTSLCFVFRKWWIKGIIGVTFLILILELSILRPGVNFRLTIDEVQQSRVDEQGEVIPALRIFLRKVESDNLKVIILSSGIFVMGFSREKKYQSHGNT